MELGNHAEFLDVMTRSEMLATFFTHDGGETQTWRLKKHAANDFWAWVSSWAVTLRHPRDMGYEMDGFDLPPIHYQEHVVESDISTDTGETLFMTLFTNRGPGRHTVAFAAPYAGKIIPLDLSKLGGAMVCQKDSLLCAARGVSIQIAFQKKIGVGLFGGEGFIMQRLEGDGLVFVHAGGTIHALDLKPGETLRVDTGCIVALQPSVNYDIQFVGKIKTALFGGEGLFFATLTGPGKVWLQSLPLSRLADRIYRAAPQQGGKGGEEGSILNVALGGIGRAIGGSD
jgi:uncharacterized protein (AIM24 family)